MDKEGSVYNFKGEVMVEKFDSVSFWENRYKKGGNSGKGSRGRELAFKAAFINIIIEKHGIKSILDMGCGDGELASKLVGFSRYVGYDISETAISYCNTRFLNRSDMIFVNHVLDSSWSFDIVMSIDVLYHVVNDDDYNAYLELLFSGRSNTVLLYSVNSDRATTVPFMKYRVFTDWIAEHKPEFTLQEYMPYPEKDNGIAFYLYMRK